MIVIASLENDTFFLGVSGFRVAGGGGGGRVIGLSSFACGIGSVCFFGSIQILSLKDHLTLVSQSLIPLLRHVF